MLIKCPNCSVKYEIPEEIGLVEGRKLKCSDCNHVFVYTQALVEVEPEESQNNLKEGDEQLALAEEPVLTSQEEMVQTDVFLPDAEQEVVPKDDLAATFTPVTQENGVPEVKYHLPWFAWIFCVLLLLALAIVGFYYADFISADYLLGSNRKSQTEMDIARRHIAARRRNKLKQSHQVIVQRLADARQRKKQERDSNELAQPSQDVVTNSEPEEITKDAIDGEPMVQEPQSVLDTAEGDDISSLDPIVTYKDKEIIYEEDGSMNVRMKGSIQNPSQHELVLPPVVHATAFDANGQELFSKDIHLTNRYLDAGQTQDFFGSYHWQPEDKNIQIQWIDMSF